ncbi:Arc family DNA-binding protein [Sinorhizobium meliloti]|uniref:Arc family DNA-binding protein n=1 Tax=Rhizobium meliloti TaxID=382 RepID=UPI000FD44E66|nr:Arc family DNA-binding protein [Sinorhizobium meliloti]RVH98820.1 Arc family DNA-binding protein [Sinorhizobium meliloti]
MTERVQFKLMIPSDLKEALESAAHENRRSLSAEIIHRLSATVEADTAEKKEVATAPLTNLDDAAESLSSINAKYEALLSDAQAIHQAYTATMKKLLKDDKKS